MFAQPLPERPQPEIYLLPAPLKTVPTPKRMTLNRKVTGSAGIMVTGLDGVSVLCESIDDMARAFTLLTSKPIPVTGAVDTTYHQLGLADALTVADGSSPVLPVDAPAIQTPTGKRTTNEDTKPTPLPLVNNTPRIFATGLEFVQGRARIRIGGDFKLLWMLELSGALKNVEGFAGWDGQSYVYLEYIPGGYTLAAHKVREFITVWKPTERDLQRWENVIGDNHAPERAPYEYIRRENDETDTMRYRS